MFVCTLCRVRVHFLALTSNKFRPYHSSTFQHSHQHIFVLNLHLFVFFFLQKRKSWRNLTASSSWSCSKRSKTESSSTCWWSPVLEGNSGPSWGEHQNSFNFKLLPHSKIRTQNSILLGSVTFLALELFWNYINYSWQFPIFHKYKIIIIMIMIIIIFSTGTRATLTTRQLDSTQVALLRHLTTCTVEASFTGGTNIPPMAKFEWIKPFYHKNVYLQENPFISV